MFGRTGWRLLVAFSLILVVSVLRGQELQTTRSDVFGPGLVVHSPGDHLTMQVPFTAPGLRGIQGSRIAPKMMRSAGIIFSGKVISISRAATSPGEQAAPTVITFQVLHAIRGAVVGRNLTIREWAGLWNDGERYRVGEQVFLFLHPPSRLGLTSPVAGRLGRLVMDPHGRILMRPETTSAFAPDVTFEGKSFVPYSEFEQALQRVRY
jgi:hypothetical protein